MVLSSRQRNMLGKRTAMPLLCRGLRAMPSNPNSNTKLGWTLRTGPKLSIVVLRIIASTSPIACSTFQVVQQLTRKRASLERPHFQEPDHLLSRLFHRKKQRKQRKKLRGVLRSLASWRSQSSLHRVFWGRTEFNKKADSFERVRFFIADYFFFFPDFGLGFAFPLTTAGADAPAAITGCSSGLASLYASRRLTGLTCGL